MQLILLEKLKYFIKKYVYLDKKVEILVI